MREVIKASVEAFHTDTYLCVHWEDYGHEFYWLACAVSVGQWEEAAMCDYTHPSLRARGRITSYTAQSVLWTAEIKRVPLKKWIIQEETRSRKHVVHLTWLKSSAITCSHVKQIKKLWYYIYSHYFMCSKCDFLPVFVFLLLLSFLPLKWHIALSNNLIQTSSGRVLLYQGRTLPGVFVIFKQSHFDVVHSITKSNQSPSGNNVLLTFTNL